MAIALLAPAVAHALRTQAAAAYPREACGLLGGVRAPGELRLDRYLPQANAAIETDRFAIEPLAILRAGAALRASGRELLAVFHSHPDRSPTPSAADRRGAWASLLQIIGPVHRGAAGWPCAWSPADGWIRVPLVIA
jgi:proteasome lid subunit RPN8/RPN11